MSSCAQESHVVSDPNLLVAKIMLIVEDIKNRNLKHIESALNLLSRGKNPKEKILGKRIASSRSSLKRNLQYALQKLEGINEFNNKIPLSGWPRQMVVELANTIRDFREKGLDYRKDLPSLDLLKDWTA